MPNKKTHQKHNKNSKNSWLAEEESRFPHLQYVFLHKRLQPALNKFTCF